MNQYVDLPRGVRLLLPHFYVTIVAQGGGFVKCFFHGKCKSEAEIGKQTMGTRKIKMKKTKKGETSQNHNGKNSKQIMIGAKP